MARIPQVGEPPYNEPDRLLAKFPDQPTSFKGLLRERNYILTIPRKYSDIPSYWMNGTQVKVKLFDTRPEMKYPVYVVHPNHEDKGSYIGQQYYPYPWLGVYADWLQSPYVSCNCELQVLMCSGCQCGGA